MSCGQAVITYSSSIFQFSMFFKPLVQWPPGLANAGVIQVIVTSYVVYGPTLMFHEGFVFVNSIFSWMN